MMTNDILNIFKSDNFTSQKKDFHRFKRPFSASGWPLRSCEVDEAIASLRCRLDRFHRVERKDEDEGT